MIVTRTSVLTGKVRTRNIPVKERDLDLYEKGYASIQDAMPYLDSSDREFILCGITNNEFKHAFSKQLKEIVSDDFGVKF